MPNENTEGRFVLTLGLKYNKPIERHLDKMFWATNRIYNGIVAEKRKDLESLQQSALWKANEEIIRSVYKKAHEENRSLTKEEEWYIKPFKNANKKLLFNFGFSGYGFAPTGARLRAPFGFDTIPKINTTILF